MTPTEVMQEQHKMLRDGRRAEDLNWAHGHLEALNKVGLIDDEQRRLWVLALKSCPGHEDEGGRVWCAYCGKLSPHVGEQPK